jgi:hypothetical protein
MLLYSPLTMAETATGGERNREAGNTQKEKQFRHARALVAQFSPAPDTTLANKIMLCWIWTWQRSFILDGQRRLFPR